MAKAKKFILKNLFTKKNIFIFFLLSVILILGNKLRSFSYDSVPHPGETADEYEYAWVGLSLIKDRTPIGWTGIEHAYKSYELKKINVDNLYDKEPQRPPFIIVSPMLEKPPLFPLLIGAYSYMKGVREFAESGVGIIRRPMLPAALLTSILVFILAWRLYGSFVAFLSVFLYSTIPSVVFSSRIVIPENAFTPLFLGALIFTDLYIVKKNKIFWILAALLSFLGIMMKQSAIVILLALLLVYTFYLSGKVRRKILTATFLIGILGIVFFILYGAYYDWGTFLKIFSAQSQLFYGAGSEVFYSAIMLSKITATRFFTDGWVTLGWISFLIVSFTEFKKEKGGTILTLSIFAYLVTFLLFGSEAYGWYRFPFFPFLVIATARIFQKLYISPNLPVFTALALLPFGPMVHRIIGLEGWQNYVTAFRGALILIFLLFWISLWFKMKKSTARLEKAFFILVFVLLALLSIKEIYFYTYDKWFFVN